MQSLYENGLLSQATGGSLRPGGLALTHRLLEWCGWPADVLLLEVGCGSGATTAYLRTLGFSRVIGIDRSARLLGAARSAYASQPPQTGAAGGPAPALVRGAGQALPFPGAGLDGILAECSLSAIADVDGALAEFARVLRPGSILALSDVYAREPAGIPALRALPPGCGLREALSQSELTGCLQAHGFAVQAWEDHSQELKTLAAQLIFSHGSLNEFWSRSTPAADPMELQLAIRKAKLGYFLLAAKKI